MLSEDSTTDGTLPLFALFGAPARALAPRALVAGRLPEPAARLAELFLREPSVDTRRTLVSAGGRLRRVPGGLRLWIEAEQLDELATTPELRLLQLTWLAALRPPARPRVMGVLNVTDDSFSDGGRFRSVDAALSQGLKLLAEGADILDVGGESTRPGSREVALDEELERVLPVIERLVDAAAPVISIDTKKSAVARAALEAGATIVNDVSAGLADPALLDVAAKHGAGVILMHMRGTPASMQDAPTYSDVVGEVHEFLRERAAAGLKAGIPHSRIVVDPGIGFGKRLEDNVKLLRATSELRSLGLPVLLGVSRKSFLGALAARGNGGTTPPPTEREVETLAAVTLGTSLGADLQRVHDVASARRAIAIATSLHRPSEAHA